MKRRITLTATALALGSSVIGLGSASPAHAAPMTFLVDTLSDNPADGYTLREALADADANAGPDTVGFVDGLSGTLALVSGSLSSNDSLTLEGPADAAIVIDAGGTSRVLNSFFPGSDLTVRNLTMTGGSAAFQGGAIAIYQGNDVTLESMTFVDNATAEDGGAVSIGSITGETRILDSTFSDNTSAQDAGALRIFEHDDGGPVHIDRTEFRGNTSTGGSGGAIRANTSDSSFFANDVIIDDNEAVIGDAGGLLVAARFVSMNDVAITNNVAFDDNGGADIRSTSANVNLSRLDISGNEAFEVGGAMIRSASVVNLSDSVVSANRADASAGLRLSADSTVNVRTSTILDNEATTIIGGASVIDTPKLLVEESTISHNTAPAAAGMYVSNVADAEVRYSTFANNDATAGDGGGIVATGAPTDRLLLSNSTLSANTATGNGGGIIPVAVELVVSRSTIVGNEAGTNGGGFFQAGGSTVNMGNSVLADNTAPMFPNLNGPVFVEWSLLGNTGGTAFIGGTDNITDADPLLAPLADNGGPTDTHLPTAASPLIDAGDPNVLFVSTSRDQRGSARRSGPAADIGAVEVASTTGSIWTPVLPSRIVDTRTIGETVDGLDQADGEIAAGSETTIDVAGRAGIPEDARGVVANLTAIRPGNKGFLTAHPCAGSLPLAASLNYEAGVTLGNEIIVGLDDTGALCVFTSAATHLTIDVVGYIGADSVYTPTEPARFLETRADEVTLDGESQAIGRLEAGETVAVRIRNRGDVHIDATAAVMYVTAIRPDAVGFLTIWNCATDQPLASSLNFMPGANRGNEVVMNTEPKESEVCIFSSAAVDLTVDVVGFVQNLPSNHASLDTPVRLLDSRESGSTIDGEFAGDGVRTSGSALMLQVGGRAGVPPTAQTVTMNLTAVRPGGIGYVTAFPCSDEPPLAASLNHVPGVNGGNEIVASLDANGQVCLFTSADAHLTADITGYTTI